MRISGKQLRLGLSAIALSVGLSPSAWAANLNQQQLTTFATDAKLNFAVISNFGSKPQARITVTNDSSVALPAGVGEWRIYIHSVRRLDTTEVEGLTLRHIQGDLHEILPGANFKGLPPGAAITIPYSASASLVSYTDFMPRAFIAQPGLKAEIFANTDTENITQFVEAIASKEQQLRGESDRHRIATAETRYQDNLPVNQAAKPSATAKIIPTPAEVKYRSGSVALDSSWHIHYAGRLTSEANYLAAQLGHYGLKLKSSPELSGAAKVIELRVDATKAKPEGYSLNIAGDRITVVGGDNAGAFYGIQSILSLIPTDVSKGISLPQLSVNDAPRFAWRGMQYDMGRNFHGKEITLRLIEQMGRYKLNKLHLHLTEDEGWRLEIPGLPELTEVGAHRCFDLSEQSCLLTQLGTGPHRTGSGNGYYTTDDFIEIIKFAAARHIEVIPEIDMPGHARAAVKSMEARYHRLMKAGKTAEAEQYLLSDPLDKSQYLTVQNYTDNSVNVCLPSTYVFVDKVIYELQQMYRKAGSKLQIFHMGGDEVGVGSWSGSPACAALFAKGEQGVAGVADLKPYFVSRLANITNTRGSAGRMV